MPRSKQMCFPQPVQSSLHFTKWPDLSFPSLNEHLNEVMTTRCPGGKDWRVPRGFTGQF